MNTVLDLPVLEKKTEKTSLKSLAEAIILQAIEDLWNSACREETVAFFCGDGFRRCADIAGMNEYEKLKLIRMVKKAMANTCRPLPGLKMAVN